MPDCGHEVMSRKPGLFNEALAAFFRATETVATARPSVTPRRPRRPTRTTIQIADAGPSSRTTPNEEAPMTTLLALFRRPDGGDEALETFRRRYHGEHLPLIAQTPGLRATRVWRVAEALGAETDLVTITAMDFDDRAALDAGLASDAMRRRPEPPRDRARPRHAARRRGRPGRLSRRGDPGLAPYPNRPPAATVARTEGPC